MVESSLSIGIWKLGTVLGCSNSFEEVRWKLRVGSRISVLIA